MTLKIETGACYRTRDGRKVGPMDAYGTGPSGELVWEAMLPGEGTTHWHDHGALWTENEAHGTENVSSADLIAEWTD